MVSMSFKQPVGHTHLLVGLYTAEVCACLYVLYTQRARRTLGSQIYLVSTTMCLFLFSTSQVIFVLPNGFPEFTTDITSVIVFAPRVYRTGIDLYYFIQEILYVLNK